MVKMASSTSFDDLNDDCICLIIEVVANFFRHYCHKGSTLMNLSLVSRRIRFLCRPFLLNPKKPVFLPSLAWGRAKPTVETFKALVKADFLVSSLQ